MAEPQVSDEEFARLTKKFITDPMARVVWHAKRVPGLRRRGDKHFSDGRCGAAFLCYAKELKYRTRIQPMLDVVGLSDAEMKEIAEGNAREIGVVQELMTDVMYADLGVGYLRK